MKILTLLGIRPDLIRMSLLLPQLDKEFDNTFCWTGQHYSPEMSSLFFNELKIREPDIDLKVGKHIHDFKRDYNYVDQISLLFQEFYKTLKRTKPDIVLSIGDTNSVTASFIAARESVPFVHLEGGMRSFDWRMPEEKNRVLADNMSDFIFAYMQHHKDNLVAEGIEPWRIDVVGNTIVDVIREKVPSMWSPYRGKPYILATIHREENTCYGEQFEWILDELNEIGRDIPVVLPLIPSARKRLPAPARDWSHIEFIRPVPFLECIKLQREASYVITDSGTLAEETCVLGTPCMIARQSTERPEVVAAGGAVMMGKSLVETYYKKLKGIKPCSWRHNLGDGQAYKKIILKLKSLEANDFFRQSRSPDFIHDLSKISKSRAQHLNHMSL